MDFGLVTKAIKGNVIGVYAGHGIHSTETIEHGPDGWVLSKTGTNAVMRITHNLGHGNYEFIAMSVDSVSGGPKRVFALVDKTDNYVDFEGCGSNVIVAGYGDFCFGLLECQP